MEEENRWEFIKNKNYRENRLFGKHIVFICLLRYRQGRSGVQSGWHST